MDGVLVDGDGEVGADGTGVGFLRIGGAHQLAVLGDGVLAFQDLDYNRTGSHEGNQVLEERTLFVLGIEATGFTLGQLNHFSGDDAQAGFLEAGQDFADHVLGNGVRLDDGQGALQCHW